MRDKTLWRLSNNMLLIDVCSFRAGIGRMNDLNEHHLHASAVGISQLLGRLLAIKAVPYLLEKPGRL